MVRAGALMGGLAVAAGAFGSHFLQSRLTPEDLAIFETGVRYQMYHALALIVCAVLGRGAGLAAHSFLWGTCVFSGSLYLLVSTGPRWLGAITPIGGTLLLVGWAALAFRAWPETIPSSELAHPRTQ
jgi:uncharacterized membrane protein YgdD (TMEM256/DUF423 family)